MYLPEAHDEDGHGKCHLFSVRSSVPKDIPSNLGVPALDGQSSIDFINLIDHQFVVQLSISMVLSQYSSRFIGSSMGKQPSGTLRYRRQHANKEDRWETLDQTGDTPAPTCTHMTGSEASPSSNDGTNIEKAIEETQHCSSLPWMCKLGNHGRPSNVNEADTNAEQASSDHELRISEGRSLYDGTDESESRADVHAHLASIVIRYIRSRERADETANEDDGCDETYMGSVRVVHVCVLSVSISTAIFGNTFQPRLHRLKVPNDNFIIPTSHLRRDNTNDHQVQLPHSRILPPFWMGVVPQSLGNINIRRRHPTNQSPRISRTTVE